MDATEKRNGTRLIWANGLQNIGDQIVAAKTVLPWLLQMGGAPSFLLALLVPIRESGSMLPQAAITGWVLSQKSRVRVWVIGSLGQFLSALGIGLAALVLHGWALGLVVIALLACLSLCRALCSISSKDVQGATISKGHRGEITGRATMIGGAFGLLTGLGLAWWVGDNAATWLLSTVVIVCSFSWLVAALVFNRIETPDCTPSPRKSAENWLKRCFDTVRTDEDFRKFVIVRSMMLVTSLSTAFIVALAAESGHNLSALGFFLIASGLASIVGGRISGVWSDRSSKNVMAVGALWASIILLVVVSCSYWVSSSITQWIYPLAFFLVNIAHTAVRVARKTYVLDMAEGDQRTRYVADANTLMGLILLLVGALSGALSVLGNDIALIFLAIIGLCGVFFAKSLKEVSQGA
ncbi:MFS transporter [Corynebacterium callunae]|uniref:MFS transporter n=1 Tax=Corynebacterium callunae TaxID=1721 RepID=UPI00398253A6